MSLRDLDINIYSRLKDKTKMITRQENYMDLGLSSLANIVAIDDFEKKTGLNPDIFQLIKYCEGMVGLYKYEGAYVMCKVTQVGLPDNNWRPKEVNATFYYNQQVVTKHNLVVDKDIVLLYNDAMSNPEDLIGRLSDALADVDNSMRLNIKYSRYLPLLRAKDKKEYQVLKEAIDAMDKGQQTVIIDDDMFADKLMGNGSSAEDYLIKLTDVDKSQLIQYLSELHETYNRWFHNTYGMYMNGGSKHAQQSVREIDSAESSSWSRPLIFLSETQQFCDRCYDVFGLELTAHFGELHELLWHQFANKCTEDTKVDEDTGLEVVADDDATDDTTVEDDQEVTEDENDDNSTAVPEGKAEQSEDDDNK